MGNVRFGIPEAIAWCLAREWRLRVAIETGTFRGDSAAVLAGICEEVFTIERDPELAFAAKQRFVDEPRIRVVAGDSRVALPATLAAVTDPALIWLDSHWFGGVSTTSEQQCSLLDEVRAIATWPHACQSVLLIDDVDLLEQLPSDPRYRVEEWPSLDCVVGLVSQLLPRHEQTLEEDVLVVAPRVRSRCATSGAVNSE
jgi:hypothetical protein